MSGRGIKSAETSDRLTQTYAPGQLTQVHCADEGGMYGVSDDGVGVDVRGGSTCMYDRAWGPDDSPA